MTPADLLDAGADVIDTKGWWNGVPDPAGPAGTCMVLALSFARSPVECEDAPWDEAVGVLCAYLGFPSGDDSNVDDLFDWNDSHSHAEVVEAMRKAAQEWRNDH